MLIFCVVGVHKNYTERVCMKRRATFQLAPSPKKQRPNNALARSVLIAQIPRKTEERKNIDVLNTAAIVAATTTSSLFLLNGVDDGALATQRVGRRITMTSLEIRWSGSFAATTAGSSPLRLVVIYDKQTNGLAPLATDVFQVDLISSMMNLGNSRRFKVIIDELVENVSSAGPSGWNRKLWRDFTAKGTQPGLEVSFNANSTANVDSIQTGSLYAFVWQNGNLITAAPTQALYSRVRFTDN